MFHLPKKKKLQQLIPFTLFSLLLLCAALPLLFLYWTPMKDQVYDFSLDAPDGEVVTDTKNWEVFLNEKGKITPLTFDQSLGYEGLGYNGQTFYYSRTLDQKLENPMLQIGVANRSISVFLDNELLYSDWPELDNRIGYLELPMQEYDRADPITLSLPTDYYGKTLTIAQSTGVLGNEKQIGESTVYLCSVKLYCSYAYESSLIAQATRTAYPAMICFLLGTLLLLVALYQGRHGNTDWGIPFLSVYLYLYAAGFIIKAPFFIKYLAVDFLALPDLNTLVKLAGITCLLFYLCIKMTGPARWVLTVFTLLQAGGSGAEVLRVTDKLPVLLPLGHLFSVIALSLALFLSFLQLRRKNEFFIPFCNGAVALSCCYLAVLAGSRFFCREYWDSVFQRLGQISYSNVFFPLRLLQVLFLVCCIYAAAISFLRHLSEEASKRTTLRLREKMARESYEHIRSQARETAMMRHDLTKHLTALEGLLTDSQSPRALEYIQNILHQTNTFRSILNTGNYLLDILLNSRLAMAEDAGTQVEILRSETPSSFPVEDTDLCSILLNAMDNALLASSNPASLAHWIRLDLHMKGDLFYFCLENSAPETEYRRKKSTKKTAVRKHGYGLFIMERTAEKYGGMLRTKRLPGRFRTEIILPARTDSPQSDTN